MINKDMLAKEMRELRVSKGWKSTELGLASGVSNSFVSKIENGKANNPTQCLVDKVLVTLGLSEEERAIFLVKHGLMAEEKFDPTIMTNIDFIKQCRGDAEKYVNMVKSLPSQTKKFISEMLVNEGK